MDEWKNLLFHGDNKKVLEHLMGEYRGKINLIYIDPPFFSRRKYMMTREDGTTEVVFSDEWKGGMQQYLSFMKERLILMRELLSDDGLIYVHLDWHAVHYVKVMMDEIFGYENFRNEIIWCYISPSNKTKDFPNKHDIILRYSKSDNYFSNLDAVRIPYKEELHTHKATGKIWKRKGKLMDEKLKMVYMARGKIPEDHWSDIPSGGQISKYELLGFDTQKPEKLLKRIILASSKEGDIIADFFCGSGTTLAVAEKLNRRWIGCDISERAIEVCKKRLSNISNSKDLFDEKGKYNKEAKQYEVIEMG